MANHDQYDLEKNLRKQLEDLKEIVKFAYDNAPYYKRSFDEAGVKPEDIRSLKDLQKLERVGLVVPVEKGM